MRASEEGGLKNWEAVVVSPGVGESGQGSPRPVEDPWLRRVPADRDGEVQDAGDPGQAHEGGPSTRGAMGAPALPISRVPLRNGVQDCVEHTEPFPQGELGPQPGGPRQILAQHRDEAQADQRGGPTARPTGLQAPAVLPPRVPDPTAILPRARSITSSTRPASTMSPPRL